MVLQTLSLLKYSNGDFKILISDNELFLFQTIMAGRALWQKTKKNPCDFLTGDMVTCPEKKCKKEYANISSLTRHLVNKHHYSSSSAFKVMEESLKIHGW